MPDDVEDEIGYSVEQIDNFLENFELDEDGAGLGFLVDWTYHGKNTTSIEVNVRGIDPAVPGEYRYDISVLYEDIHPEWLLNGTYKDWVREIESQYPKAEVRAREFNLDSYI